MPSMAWDGGPSLPVRLRSSDSPTSPPFNGRTLTEGMRCGVVETIGGRRLRLLGWHLLPSNTFTGPGGKGQGSAAGKASVVIG